MRVGKSLTQTCNSFFYRLVKNKTICRFLIHGGYTHVERWLELFEETVRALFTEALALTVLDKAQRMAWRAACKA